MRKRMAVALACLSVGAGSAMAQAAGEEAYGPNSDACKAFRAGTAPHPVGQTCYSGPFDPRLTHGEGAVHPLSALPQLFSHAGVQRYTFPDGRQVLVDPRTGQTYLHGRVGDIDGDGVRDSRDTDRDGDGVKNYRDRYPDDPRLR